METNGNRKSNTFWRGMFIGAVAGSIITLLYTPRTGGEMRSAIREKAGKTKDKLGEWKHKSKHEAEQKAHELESMIRSES